MSQDKQERDIISGRLTKDPITKERVTYLSIGKNVKLPDDGSGQKSYGKTLWIKIVCFKAAKEVADSLSKGDFIRAHGELYCGEDFTKTDGTVMKGEAEFKCFKLEQEFPFGKPESSKPRVDEVGAPRRVKPSAKPVVVLEIDDGDSVPF